MNIDPKLFYKTGFVCFLIIALCGVANFIIYFKNYNFFTITSSLASLVFNFMLTGFFYYLLKSQTSSLPAEKPEDLEEALTEFSKNGAK